MKQKMKTPTEDVDVFDSQQMSPLHHACDKGHVEVVKELLRVSSKSIDALDVNCRSPFGSAVHQRQRTIARHLLPLTSLSSICWYVLRHALAIAETQIPK